MTLRTGVNDTDSDIFDAAFGRLFECQTHLQLLRCGELEVITTGLIVATETFGEVTENVAEQFLGVYVGVEALETTETLTTTLSLIHIVGCGAELIVLSSLRRFRIS